MGWGPLSHGPSPRTQRQGSTTARESGGGTPSGSLSCPQSSPAAGEGLAGESSQGPRNTPGTALMEAPLPTRAVWRQPPLRSPPCTITSPMGTTARSHMPPHLAPTQAARGCPRATAEGAHTLKSGASPPGWPCLRAGPGQAARLPTAGSTCPRCLSSGLGTDTRGREASEGPGHAPRSPPTRRTQSQSRLS